MTLFYILSGIVFSCATFWVLYFLNEPNATKKFRVSSLVMLLSILVFFGSWLWERNADTILNGESTATKLYIYENTEYVIWEDDTTHEYFVLRRNPFDIACPNSRVYLSTEQVDEIDAAYIDYEESGKTFTDMRNILLGREDY